MDAEQAVDASISALADFDLITTQEASASPPSHYLRDHRHEYVRTVRDILRTKPLQHGKIEILEIGAFFGAVCMALSSLGYAVTAADIPEYIELPEQVERFKRYGIATKGVRLENFRLPFPDESFDVLIMCEVLEHLNFNPLPLIKEINRVLKPNGLFYLSLPNFARAKNRMLMLHGKAPGVTVDEFYTQLDPAGAMIANGHWREYTMAEVKELLLPMGFLIQEHYYFSAGETKSGGSIRKRLGRWFYQNFPTLKENQTALAIRAARTTRTFTIPPTVHKDIRLL